MNKEEILQFINSNPVCHLASVENNCPHVRGMLIYRADREGIIFHTGTRKDLYMQLINNPNVEMCFNDQQKGLQIRVSGKVELVEDPGLKEEIVKNREFMRPCIRQYGYQMLAVFNLKHGRVTLWTFEKNFDAKNYIDL